MQKSKLIGRLRLIEREELRNFGKFVESPYHNTDEKVIRLFDYLKKYYPIFEHKKLDRDYIASKLFPEWKGNIYKKLSRVMSSLSDRIEDFFVFKEIEKDKLEYRQFLLKAYKYRKGDWFFNQTADTLGKALLETQEQGIAHYFHQYRLNQEIYTHTATERVEKGIESFKNAIDNLDVFYFGIKFMYASEVYFRELYYSEKSELLLIDNMQERINNPVFENKKHISVFSTIIDLYKTREKSTYKVLKNLVLESSSQFSTVEKLDMVTMCNNFCIMEYNHGKMEYLIEIFDLHEYGLEQGLWLADGFINYSIFNNIVGIACGVKKFDWTRDFILRYAKYLREEVRANVRVTAMCLLEFSMGNFEEVLELLRDVEFLDLHHNLNAKSYQLRCYFELEGYETLFYDASNAFSQYCRRHKIIGTSTQKQYLNFISMIKRIYQNKYEQKENEASMLKELKESPHVYAKWLKEKIQEEFK